MTHEYLVTVVCDDGTEKWFAIDADSKHEAETKAYWDATALQMQPLAAEAQMIH